MNTVMPRVVAAADASPAWKAVAEYPCTGTADDVVLNKALSAGKGTVTLSNGTFNLSATAVIPNAAVSLVGQGACATVLKAAPGLKVPPLRIEGPTTPGQYGILGQSVRYLGIGGEASQGPDAHGLEIAGANFHVVLDGLRINGAHGHGVFIHSAPGGERPAYCKVRDCDISNGARDGIRIGEPYPSGRYAEHIDVTHSVISFMAGAGIAGVGNNCCIDATRLDSVEIGVLLEGAENCSVVTCTFDNCRQHWVKIDGGGLHVVSGNFCGSRAGGYLEGSAGMLLTGNTSGNLIGLNRVIDQWGPGHNGWEYCVRETVGVGQSGSGFWGPTVYAANAFSWGKALFEGKPSIIGLNTASDPSLLTELST